MKDEEWEMLRRVERRDRIWNRVITLAAWTLAVVCLLAAGERILSGSWIAAIFFALAAACVKVALSSTSSIKLNIEDIPPEGRD